MDSQSNDFLLLRSNANSKWEDEHGSFYQYGSNVPNHKRIQPGVRVVIERKEKNKQILFVGHAEINNISEHGTDDKGNTIYHAYYDKFHEFGTPIERLPAIQSKIESVPGFNRQYSIRPLTELLFMEIVQLSNDYIMWDRFLTEWPLERVKTMQLQEYSNAGEKNTFIHWLESKLDKLGSMWGGSSFKFGVYSRNDSQQMKDASGRMYSDEYAWYSKYGNTADIAFEKVKSLIVETIEASVSENYHLIDGIDLGDAYKWKIASLYQSRKNPGIVLIFKKEMLIYLTKSGPKVSISDMHKKLIEEKEQNISLINYSRMLWNKCATKSDMPDDIPSEPLDIDELSEVINNSNLQLSDGMTSSFVAALQSKPFVLLTGLSGSGKTKLAQVLSKCICAGYQQYELIAVGADWTSNENLLGYPDALTPDSYRKPDNGALDLILRAKDDPEHPYFLILDEMNLSHVERYFADFLSAMESGEAISLHDDTGEDWDGVPAKLEIPKNLFVIGTVNVDETTYMFSPKVLDRANVIEFRVSDEEMKSFLTNPVKPDLNSIAGKGAHYAKAFVAAATQNNISLNDDTREKVSDVLMKFFPELKKAGAEFGYRTAHEICRFIHFYKDLSGEEWNFESAMDAAIMQKLLPKLHGSKKKLGPVLSKLIRLCLKADGIPENDPIKDEYLIEDNATYWTSLEKLKRMRKRLGEHGFTSFAEA